MNKPRLPKENCAYTTSINGTLNDHVSVVTVSHPDPVFRFTLVTTWATLISLFMWVYSHVSVVIVSHLTEKHL